MLKIAICDDEKIFIDTLYSHLKPIFNNMYNESEFSSFQNAPALLNAFKADNFDVIFLDIDMPKMSGFEVAKEIRNISTSTLIIFVTSKHDLVYNSFDYQPFYFICKSSIEKLQNDLTHVAEKLTAFFRQNKKIEIEDIATGKFAVSLSDIIYIKSDKHYLLYYLNNGDKTPLKERGKIAKKEVELAHYDFLKPHQRYLVNMNYINRFDTILNSILMTNKDIIPISKSSKDDVLEKFRIFKRR